MSFSKPYVTVTVPFAGALSADEVRSVVLPFAANLESVTATVGTAPTGAAAEFDVLNNAGASVLGNATAANVSIAAAATTSAVVGAKNALVADGVTSFDHSDAPNAVSSGINVLGGWLTVDDTAPIAAYAAGDKVQVKVLQVGSTVAGSDAVVLLTFQKA